MYCRNGNSNTNSLNFDFVNSSANDFWKFESFDFRDSNKHFNEMYQDSAQFLSYNYAVEENFSSNLRSSNKGNNHKLTNNDEVAFEVREETPSMDINTILSESTALLMQGQYSLALKFLDTNAPLLMINNPLIRISISKLELFKSVISNDIDYSLKCFEGLKTQFTILNIYNQRKIDIIECLIQFPEVLKSRFYNLHKQEQFVQSIGKIINYELLGADAFFMNATQDHNMTYDKIYEENIILRDMEDELIFYQACFNKMKEITDDFDEFMFNTKLTFDSKSVLSNNILIDEFIKNIKASNKKVFETQEALPCSALKDNTPERKRDSKQSKQSAALFGVNKNEINLKTNNTNFFAASKILQPKNEFTFNKEKVIAEDDKENSESYSHQKNKSQKQKNIKLNALKNISFKFLKRENIDKKTLRKFKRYLSLRIKQIDPNYLTKFVLDFCGNLLFPPFSFGDQTFKSFNTSYLIWLFSHQEMVGFYEEYIDLNLSKMVDFLASTFKVTDPNEIGLLSGYLKSMAQIYSNLTSEGKVINPGSINLTNMSLPCISSDLNVKMKDINDIKRGSKDEEKGVCDMSLEKSFMRLSVENFPNKEEESKSPLIGMNKKEKEEPISNMFDQYAVDMDF